MMKKKKKRTIREKHHPSSKVQLSLVGHSDHCTSKTQKFSVSTQRLLTVCLAPSTARLTRTSVIGSKVRSFCPSFSISSSMSSRSASWAAECTGRLNVAFH